MCTARKRRWLDDQPQKTSRVESLKTPPENVWFVEKKEQCGKLMGKIIHTQSYNAYLSIYITYDTFFFPMPLLMFFPRWTGNSSAGLHPMQRPSPTPDELPRNSMFPSLQPVKEWFGLILKSLKKSTNACFNSRWCF